MHRSPPISVRYLFSSVIILAVLATLYPLAMRLLAQMHFTSAEKRIVASQYTEALTQLRKAVALQGNDFQIHNELGNVYYKLASKDKESDQALQLLGKAREHFQEALRLLPLDARSAYGLARAEVLIEKTNYLSGKESLLSKDSPALSALEKAIALRPASTVYRLAYARYLYLHEETEKLLAQMRILGSLQPSLHGSLRHEMFWSSAARQEFFAGVEQALAQGVNSRQSLLAASELRAEEENWKGAASLRQQGMREQSSLNSAADFIRLGFLHLKTGEPDQAAEDFSRALSISNDIEEDIITVMLACKNAGSPESLISFYRQASRRFGNSLRMDIAAARYLFDLKKYEPAKRVLLEANTRRQSGEAYYWLARIAEVEDDWDEVELSIQRAAMLDPENSSYHLVFSQVLNRLQKYDRAEKEAGLAIDNTEKASAGLYHYRATLRMRKNDHAGALADWLQALTIDPGNASFFYQAGDVAEKMDRIDEAEEYLHKAITLDPGNKTYIQRLDRIVKKYGGRALQL